MAKKKSKAKKEIKGKVIGIDLGTTNSEFAVLEGNKPAVIASTEGHRYIPSIVAFTKDGERLVGEPAKRQAITNPERTVKEIKRKMGTDYKITLDDKSYKPEEISAMILSKVKQDAENYLGEKVVNAVITVPAYFNDNQRTATKDAGKIAGLHVLRIINEPTAAALAYGLDKSNEQTLAVIDLGGGTFDVTIMEIGEGVFKVLSTSGDTHLGGTDMDQVIMDYVLSKIEKEHDLDVSNDKQALQRVRDAAENAKMELTSTVSTNINMPFLAQDDDGQPVHFEMKLTRAKMENLIEPVLQRLESPMRKALKDAKLKAKDIDKVILVGGPTRMPSVRERIKKFFDKEPERGVDPMECVALGAAIQAGILAGEFGKDIVLLDVTPLSLGVETLGNIFTKILDANTTIPVERSQTFSTAIDNQPSVEIKVLQGERTMASDNILLGSFHLVGIPPAPRNIPQIGVTFKIDVNGILSVEAKDLGTGNKQEITITGSTKLKDAEIEKMQKDAQKYADEDRKKREQAELKNKCDALVYTSEKTIKDMGDKISSDNKKKIEKALEELKNAIAEDDLPAMKEKSETLTNAMHEVTTVMYQQATQAAPPPPGDDLEDEPPKKQSRKKDKNVVDADYEVMDEED
jgi:molecular chaperone DnaK